MKKILLLILITPFAYADIKPLYCQSDELYFLTLKIDQFDRNNPIFAIEDAMGYKPINKNYDKKDINTNHRLVLKVFDDENFRLYTFNKVTNVLVIASSFDNEKDYKKHKERLIKNTSLFGYKKTYECFKHPFYG